MLEHNYQQCTTRVIPIRFFHNFGIYTQLISAAQHRDSRFESGYSQLSYHLKRFARQRHSGT